VTAASESLTARLVLEPAELTAVHSCLPPGMRPGETPADVDGPGIVDERVLAGLRDRGIIDADGGVNRSVLAGLVLLADPGAVRLSVVAAGPAMVRRTSIACSDALLAGLTVQEPGGRAEQFLARTQQVAGEVVRLLPALGETGLPGRVGLYDEEPALLLAAVDRAWETGGHGPESVGEVGPGSGADATAALAEGFVGSFEVTLSLPAGSVADVPAMDRWWLVVTAAARGPGRAGPSGRGARRARGAGSAAGSDDGGGGAGPGRVAVSDGWESTGGAGGISANYDDMESLSVLYGRAALTLAEVTAEVAFIAASGELLDSAVLSPGSFAQVMGVIGELELGRTGLAASGLELGELSLHLRQAVLAYQFVDEAMSKLTIGAQNLGGFVVGAALPAIAVPAAAHVLVGESARTLPGFLVDLVQGRASLSSFPSRVLSTTAEDAQALVMAHPGMLQDGIGGVAGLEAGLQAWAPAPLRGLLMPQGVPRDYPQAVQNLAGFFRDGNPVVRPGTVGHQQPGDNTAPTSVRDLFKGVDRRQDRRQGHAVSGEIGVQRLAGPDGTTRFVVQLPGTESWALTPGITDRDLSTNLHTMAGDSTVYMRGVEEAMVQAGVPAGAPVMLVGHSLGGMTAAALAADPAFRQRFNVTQVVTAGAPIGRFEVPAGVQVLAVENRNDVVPALDGADNPDRANVTTLTFSANKGNVGKNHSLSEAYALAAADLPADDPSYAAWLESARGFLNPANQTSSTSTYAITRGPGS
jgi:hypothetical protein